MFFTIVHVSSTSQSKPISHSRRARMLPWRCLYSAGGLLSALTILHMTGPAMCTSCNVTEAASCAQDTFLNSSACCQSCTVCPPGMRTKLPCNATHDTYCVERLCTDPNTVFRENDGICVIDCDKCSYECNIEQNRCNCDPNLCYEDPEFCQRPCLPDSTTEELLPSVPSSPGNPTSLPTWGVGVIAVVAVLGIVAFSAVFLLLGVCTRKKVTEVDSEASESSSNALMTSSSMSNGTNSTYLTGYPNHSLIDLLRQSNNPLHSSLSSIKVSPKSARSSPFLSKSGGTAEYHLDTKSPVHCFLSNHSSPLPLRTLQVNINRQSKSAVV